MVESAKNRTCFKDREIHSRTTGSGPPSAHYNPTQPITLNCKRLGTDIHGVSGGEGMPFTDG